MIIASNSHQMSALVGRVLKFEQVTCDSHQMSLVAEPSTVRSHVGGGGAGTGAKGEQVPVQ